MAYKEDAIDIGGQWVGPSQPRVLRLINKLGLETVEQQWFEDDADASQHTLSSGCGTDMSPAECQELCRLTEDINSMAKSVRGPPWKRCAKAVEWDAMSAREFLNATPLSPAVVREVVLFIRTVMATEPEDLSLLYFLYYVQAGGGMAQLGDGPQGAQKWRIRGGAQQLCLKLSESLTAHPNVSLHLNCPVQQLSRQVSGTGDDVSRQLGGTGAAAAAAPRWTVTCPAGSVTLSARYVILAMSPPLWRGIRFVPELPEAYRGLSEGMYMGRVVKTIAVFERAFWADVKGVGRLEELGPVANLFMGSYAGQPALVGLVTAGAAQRLLALSEDAQRDAVLRQYERYFPGSGRDARRCTLFKSHAWVNADAFNKGCFAALMPPGLATRWGDVLGVPLWGGSVHFAGSETARRWVGYMEGAIDAGERAADAVAVSALGGPTLTSRL